MNTPSAPSRLKTLLALGDTTTRKRLEALLADRCECHSAHDTASAKKRIDAGGIDLVILDCAQEAPQPQEVLGACQGGECPPSVAVLAGYEDGALAFEAFESGARLILHKPIDETSVLGALEWIALARSSGPSLPTNTLRGLHDLVRRLRTVNSLGSLHEPLSMALGQMLEAQFVAIVMPCWDAPVLMAQRLPEVSSSIGSYVSRHIRALWRANAGMPTKWDWLTGLAEADETLAVDSPFLLASAPMILRGELVGFLSMSPMGNRFIRDQQMELLALLAEIVATRLETLLYAREVESIESEFDSLTGVLNHGTLMTRLGELARRSERAGQPLSVIVVDIDDLQAVNDRCSHHAGDLVLKHSGRLILATARKTDAVGRLSGEEFAAVLPGTDLDGALRIAERIRRGLAANLIRAGRHEVSVTASLGVVAAAPGAYVASLLIEKAIQATEKAFEQGGNQVVAASVSGESTQEVTCDMSLEGEFTPLPDPLDT